MAFIRPHEAPDLGTGRHRPAPAYGLPRILSAPGILALERQHCTQPSPRSTPEPQCESRQQPGAGALKRQREEQQEEKSGAGGSRGNASDDSHASCATAQADNSASSRAFADNNKLSPGFSLSGYVPALMGYILCAHVDFGFVAAEQAFHQLWKACWLVL